MNSTRQPFSISARPMAAARWLLPPLGGDIGHLGEPTGGDRHDLGLGDHRHGVEDEAVEGLSRRQMGLGKMPFDPAVVALGQLMLGDGLRKRAAGHPSRSACSANCGQSVLIVGSRSSLSIMPSRASSMP